MTTEPGVRGEKDAEKFQHTDEGGRRPMLTRQRRWIGCRPEGLNRQGGVLKEFRDEAASGGFPKKKALEKKTSPKIFQRGNV